MAVKCPRILLLTAMCLALAGCGGGGNSGGGMGAPSLMVSQMALQFGTSIGTPTNPTPTSLSVTTSGSGSLAFTATSDAPWLSVTPASGSTPGNLQVSVTAGNIGVSSNTGHITITAPGAQGSPATVTVTFVVANPPSNSPYWPQWGRNPQHTGMADVAGQNVAHTLADIVYDPFVTQEKAEIQGAFGETELTVHYQAPLTDGNDVYMMTKMGSYTPCIPAGNWAATNAHCGPNAWESMIWCESRFTWMPSGKLVEVWDFASDWKPEPNGGASGLAAWEPVFHAVDANYFIYVPGAGGTIWKVNKADGSVASHINPFSGANITPTDTYVAGPLSADASGNIYYNVIELADSSAGNPWTHDVQGAWLVKVTPADATATISYATLIPNAPAANAKCPGTFGSEASPPAPPWPPSPTAAPATHVCGSQRPGLNIAPAISADGSTIYTASTAHLDAMQSYLVAVKSDLSGASWVAPLQNLLNDGCGFIVQIATPANPNMPNACRSNALSGVDPTTNAKGSGVILDQASSSPTVLPDGSVLFGASTNYNGQRGHLFKFDASGVFLAAYDFGWDTTPAVYAHNGTYSVILKDNHYPVPLYCNVSSPVCAAQPAGPYFITQLNPSLNIEWQFQNTTSQNGQNGFEWCINMPAVDINGNVFSPAEDGYVYSIPQGSGLFTTPNAKLFTNQALGAAYTPLSFDSAGRIYTQNNGHLFAIGN